MAEKRKAPGDSDRGFCELVAAHLLVDRRKWLPKCASTENYASQVVVQLAEVRMRKKRRTLKELLSEQTARQEVRAEDWRRALGTGEVASGVLSSGEPGKELTAPTVVTLDDINELLTRLGQTHLGIDDWAPLKAA